MIFPPRYPDYAELHPVCWRRWWIALPVMLFLAALATMLLWPEGKPTRTLSFWFWSVGCPLSVWLVAVALRWLVWLQSVSNRETHREATASTVEAWWRYRSRMLPVEAVMLMTAVGDKESDHQALLSQPLPATPGAVEDPQGNARLYCPKVLGLGGRESRTVLLSRSLARLVLARLREADEARPIQVFCWLGDEQSLAAFSQALEFDGIRLPEDALHLQSAAELDNVIDAMPADEQAMLLCAGAGEATPSAEYAASEAGFAWLCGHRTAALMTRSEILQPETGETPTQLTEQLSRYAGLHGVPDGMLAADSSAMDTLLPSGWSAVDYVLMPWLGQAGPVTPFVMQSLALLSALQGKSCGWTTTFTESQFITGVCVPRGNLAH
ncbi:MULTISPECIES: hypothetical protein [Klebsiella]|uniref:hypothetical protein n=1 Tax=Klebsiella TaxID=570 RepID=UPI0029287A1A|nr:hypothetical protein [Klebsiella sp. 141203]MDU9366944.1 hypothetical protein [Klebsiella sp. 141203]HBW5537963.1 hypothetical protein [Klebsiella aerogenes]HCS4222007.1 hypothetical protein [Klebsiella aerogenes]HEP0586331.1 hypothetical protein [Klebsiella aerogenes]